MEAESMLAKNIASAGEKASYDAACKRLLANKVILAWIMKSCLKEYKDCSIREISEKYIEGQPQIAQETVNPDEKAGEQIKGTSTEDSTIYEGTITYDIRFYAVVPGSEKRIGLILNIEAQNDFYPGYPIIKRAIYYCSRMISSQYGTEFTGAHYDKIKKVYSIWICMNPPRNRKNSMNQYSIKEEKMIGSMEENIQNYDLMSAIMICLGNADDASAGILKLLEVLLSSDREAEEKKRILQEEFSIEMTKELESEVSVMCNLSKGVEEKGITKGIARGILFSIKNLMETMDWSADQAMDALKVSDEDRPRYREELKK